MKIVVTGAAGQLGTADRRTLSPRPAREIVPRRPAPTLDLGDAAAVEAFVAARRARRRHQLRRLQRRRRRRGSRRRRAARQCPRGPRARARGAAAAGATFVHYGTDFVFDGLADRPVHRKRTSRRRRASTRCRSCWGSGSRPTCRGITCCASRACSADRTRRSSVDRIADAIRKPASRRACSSIAPSRPSYVQDVADATWHLLESAAPAGLYHCVNTRRDDLVRAGAGDRPACSASSRTSCRCKVADVKMKARRPQYAALSNAKLAARRVSRCPRGRMRCGDTCQLSGDSFRFPAER